MAQRRLYRFRRGAVGFTPRQLAVVIIALVVAVAGVLTWIGGDELAAGGMLGAAGATIGFTAFLARSRGEPPPPLKQRGRPAARSPQGGSYDTSSRREPGLTVGDEC